MADRFLAGSYPIASREETFTSRRLTALLEAGVDTFFDITRPGETAPYMPLLEEHALRFNRRVVHHRHPVQDRGLPTPAEMAKLLDAIDEALAAGRTIYLHCLGGIGRTGTAVGCWLVRHGMSGEEALAHLNSLYQTAEQSKIYSRSPEVDAQVDFILHWKEPASSTAPVVDWHARFLQQASWTKDLRAYLFERAGLARAQRVLEVGCGTGAILSDLKGGAAIYGRRPRPASPGCRLPPTRHGRASPSGDALRLPYHSGVFDVTFCHYLLLWLRDPLVGLQKWPRVTCPGGYVLALAEPDHTSRVDQPDELAGLGRLQTDALHRQGADPSLGKRLGDLFHQAGIRLIETGTADPYPPGSAFARRVRIGMGRARQPTWPGPSTRKNCSA